MLSQLLTRFLVVSRAWNGWPDAKNMSVGDALTELHQISEGLKQLPHGNGRTTLSRRVSEIRDQIVYKNQNPPKALP